MSAIYSGLSLPEWCRFHFNELFMFMFIIYIYSSSIIPFFFSYRFYFGLRMPGYILNPNQTDQPNVIAVEWNI